MRKHKPVVYVGVVTYNSAKYILACIDALARQTYTNVRIIVFDNHSVDAIESLVKRYPSVRFIRSSINLGFGGGHNAIIRETKPGANDYYVALNPDAQLQSTYIANLVKSAQAHKAGWITGKLRKSATVLYSAGHAMLRDGYAYNIGFGCIDHGQYDTAREVFGAPGAAAMYRGLLIRALSRKGAFFDPLLFMYYEDVDIDWRAQLAGFHCWYEPTAIAEHPGGVFPRYLEAEVLSNRFISIIKNASLIDLLFYNGPLIFIHIVGRICMSPGVGMRLVTKLCILTPVALSRRSTTSKFRGRMYFWFVSGKQEISSQPISFPQRLRAFLRRRQSDRH